MKRIKKKLVPNEEAERHEYIVEYETNYNAEAEALDVKIAAKHEELTARA